MAREAMDVVPLEGRDSQVGLLLAGLDNRTRNWRAELGEVSQDVIVWQPAADSHSIGSILLHIADVEAFWLHQVAAGQPIPPEDSKLFLSEETQQYKGIWPKPPREPLEWYYAQQDRIRARTHALLAGMDDPARPCRYRTREFTLRWLLQHVLTHEAYHSGQAVLLASLRPRTTSSARHL